MVADATLFTTIEIVIPLADFDLSSGELSVAPTVLISELAI